MTAQNDPEGHGVQEAAPDVEYMPDGHGIGTLVAFDGQYLPGGHNEQKEELPTE